MNVVGLLLLVCLIAACEPVRGQQSVANVRDRVRKLMKLLRRVEVEVRQGENDAEKDLANLKRLNLANSNEEPGRGQNPEYRIHLSPIYGLMNNSQPDQYHRNPQNQSKTYTTNRVTSSEPSTTTNQAKTAATTNKAQISINNNINNSSGSPTAITSSGTSTVRTSSLTPATKPSSGTPAAIASPQPPTSAETPIVTTTSKSQTTKHSSGTPTTKHLSGTPTVTTASETPITNPSSRTTQVTFSPGTPTATFSPGTPTSSGTPTTKPSSGTTATFSLVTPTASGTPTTKPSSGTPTATFSSGTPTAAGTPTTKPSSGTPTASGTPTTKPSSGTPTATLSSGTQATKPSSETPKATTSSGSPPATPSSRNPPTSNLETTSSKSTECPEELYVFAIRFTPVSADASPVLFQLVGANLGNAFHNPYFEAPCTARYRLMVHVEPAASSQGRLTLRSDRKRLHELAVPLNCRDVSTASFTAFLDAGERVGVHVDGIVNSKITVSIWQ